MNARDYKDLLNATVQEYTRRGYGVSGVKTSYQESPETTTAIFAEHSRAFLQNLNSFPASGKAYGVSQDNIVKTSDMFDAIMYTRQLMNSVVPIQ